jgi:tetratricopeptide (TPR) repeat protein
VSAVGHGGDEIRRLMVRGLDLYALGQVEEATACWRRVLALDPDNAEARDYLQAAAGDGDVQPPPRAGAPPPAPGAGVADALRLLRGGDQKQGLALLETITGREPANLEAQGFLELARAALLRAYRARVGSGEGVPRVRIPPAEVMKYNLPAAAGFLLSMIDGRISVDELLSVSGMDPFDALRALSNLLDAGIVEARA